MMPPGACPHPRHIVSDVGRNKPRWCDSIGILPACPAHSQSQPPPSPLPLHQQDSRRCVRLWSERDGGLKACCSLDAQPPADLPILNRSLAAFVHHIAMQQDLDKETKGPPVMPTPGLTS